MEQTSLKRILEENDREISFKGLISCLSKRWKKIVCISLVFGLLGIVFNFLQITFVDTDSLAQQEKMDLEYNNLLGIIDKNLEQKEEYLSNSIRANLNNKEYFTAIQPIIVRDNKLSEQALDDVVVSLDNMVFSQQEVNAAIELLKLYTMYSIDYSEMEEKYGIDSKYISDIVTVSSVNNVAEVKVIASTQEQATELLNFTSESIKKYIPQVLTQFEDIQIDFAESQNGRVVDNGADAWLNERIQQINGLITSRNTLITNRNVLVDDSKMVDKGIVPFIKNFVIFSIVGLLLGAIWFAIKLIYSDCILSANEVNNHYHLSKIMDFSELNTDTKKMMNSDDMREIIQEELSAYDNVVIVSDLADEDINTFLDTCGINQYQVFNHLLTSAKDRKEIKNYQNAILLTKVEKSKYVRINEILKLLVNQDINVIGSLTI